jgi:2-iminoacetate synthase
LISKYGFGPHTLSVPRLQPAPGAVETPEKYRVSDEDFKKIVAIYRLSVPYTGVVISTREPAELRDELISLGASQISAGSRTSPSGYLDGDDTEQFETGDRRSLEEVMDRIADLGMIPSLCTACYREGRSGEKFRELAQKQGMKNFCHDNALLSLKEYMDDCASPEVKRRLGELIADEMEKSRNGLAEKIVRIEKGERDLHY